MPQKILQNFFQLLEFLVTFLLIRWDPACIHMCPKIKFLPLVMPRHLGNVLGKVLGYLCTTQCIMTYLTIFKTHNSPYITSDLFILLLKDIYVIY